MNIEKLIEKLYECLDEGETLQNDLSIHVDSDIEDLTYNCDIIPPPSITYKTYGSLAGYAFWTVSFTTQNPKRITHKLQEEKNSRGL